MAKDYEKLLICDINKGIKKIKKVKRIDYIKEYEEYLYRDYERVNINPKPNKIIEVCASKI